MAKRKISSSRRFLYILEYVIVIPIAFMLSLVPRGIAFFIARLLARFVYILPLHFKELCFKSLDIVFKDRPLNGDEKKAIVKRLYLSVFRYGVEFIKLRDINVNNYKKFAILEGYKNIEKGLAAGKGLIVITAHMGNWDYLGGIPAMLGHNVAVIINRQFNPYTDKWLKDMREKYTKMKSFYNEVGDLQEDHEAYKAGRDCRFRKRPDILFQADLCAFLRRAGCDRRRSRQVPSPVRGSDPHGIQHQEAGRQIYTEVRRALHI